MGLGKLNDYIQKSDIGPFPYTTQNNLKWIKYLNIRPEETIREKLLDIGLGNEFLDITTKAQATKTSGSTSN